MANSDQFLTTKGQKVYNKENRFFDRVVEEISQVSRTSFLTRKTRIASSFKQRIEIVFAAKGILTKSKVMYFKMLHGDGLSWLAQKTYDTLVAKNKENKVEIITISGTKGSVLPSIVDDSALISQASFLRLAAKHRLGEGKLWFIDKRYKYILASLLAVVLHVFHVIVIHNFKQIPLESFTDVTLLSQPLTIFSIVAAIGLTFWSEQFSIKKISNDNSSILKEVCDNLERFANFKKHDNYRSFIDEAAKLIHETNRTQVTIIDNYSQLDITSQLILRKLLISTDFPGTGKKAKKKIWIIFDLEDPKNLLFYCRLAATNAEVGQVIDRYFNFYQVLPFTEEKKEYFRKKLLNEPIDVNALAAKWIFSKQEKINTRLAAHLIAATKEEKADFDKKIKYLYLLAIASESTRLPITLVQMKNWLHDSIRYDNRKIRSKILHQFFPEAKLTYPEITTYFNDVFTKKTDEVDSELGSYLESMVASRGTYYIPYEVSATITSVHPDLNLPEAALIHVYWAIRWGDMLLNHFVQSFWVKRLTYHLVRARVHLITDIDLYLKASNHLYEIILFTIDWSIKTSIFNDIPGLLERALALCTDEEQRADHLKLRKLLRLSWEIMVLTDDKHIIESIKEITSQLAGLKISIEETGGAKKSETVAYKSFLQAKSFWLESIPNNELRKLYVELPEFSGTAALHSDAYMDLFVSDFIWFSTILNSLGGIHRPSEFLYNQDSKSTIAEVALSISRVSERILNSSRFKSRILKDENPLDFITLSNNLWNRTLITLTEKRDDFDFDVVQRDLEDVFDAIDSTLKMAEWLFTGTQVSQPIRKGGKAKQEKERAVSDRIIQSDYFFQNLVTECCLMILVRIALYSSRYRSYLDSNELLAHRLDYYVGRIQEFVFISDVNDLEKIHLNEPEELIKIDLIFDYCCVLWKILGFEKQSMELQCKRLQFRRLACYTANDSFLFAEQEGMQADLMPHVSNYTSDFNNLTGVLGWLSLSYAHVVYSNNQATYYFHRAADYVYQREFGLRLKQEIAISALVLPTGNFAVNYQELFALVLADEFLENYFKDISPENQFVAFLHISNCVRSLQKDEKRIISDRLRDIVRRLDNLIVADYYVYLDLRDGVITRPPVVELISEWGTKLDTPACPAIFNMYLENKEYNEDFRQLCFRVITQYGEDASLTHYVYLAVNYYQLFCQGDTVEEAERETIISYLEKEIPSSERLFPPAYNSIIYDIICEYRSGYEERRLYWYKQLDVEETLRDMARLRLENQDMLAEVFLGQYKMYIKSGILDHTLPSQVFPQELLFNIEDNPRKFLSQWKEKGESISPAFQFIDGHLRISSDFLILGRLLFHQEVSNDSSLEESRRTYNDLADRHMSRLFELILSMQGLIPRLEKIYRDYIDYEGKNYSFPEEEDD